MLFSLISLLKSNEFSLYDSVYFFIISFISNTFSAISGGGAGLIQLPALILSGIPYYQAIVTHKLATVALGVVGSLRNHKSLKNDIDVLFQLLIFGLPGVVLGASLIEFILVEYLYLILGIFSIFLALYTFRRSDFGLFSGQKKN